MVLSSSLLQRLRIALRENALTYALLAPVVAAVTTLRHRSAMGVLRYPPGHFYSPLPNLREIRSNPPQIYPPSGIAMNEMAQVQFARLIAAFADQPPWRRGQPRRYLPGNGWFDESDALALYGTLRHLVPRRIVEVGSGHSSAVILDVRDDALPNLKATFVDPNPARLLSVLLPTDEVELVKSKVQDVSFGVFERLEPNDVLFIDSSHVSKAGSDLNMLMFGVLPRLNPGVIVHFHDIFWPFEYPLDWTLGGRAWNELYAVRAFLQFNTAFEILFFSSFLAAEHGASVPPEVVGGGSLWLRKVL